MTKITPIFQLNQYKSCHDPRFFKHFSDNIIRLKKVLFWFILFKNRYSFSPNIRKMYFKLFTCLLSFLVLIKNIR